ARRGVSRAGPERLAKMTDRFPGLAAFCENDPDVEVRFVHPGIVAQGLRVGLERPRLVACKVERLRELAPERRVLRKLAERLPQRGGRSAVALRLEIELAQADAQPWIVGEQGERPLEVASGVRIPAERQERLR